MITKVQFVTPVSGGDPTYPTVIEGGVEVKGQDTLLISDMAVKQLLEQILIELRIMNLRDEAVTGETVNYGDVRL
jgi:hypothetical protein